MIRMYILFIITFIYHLICSLEEVQGLIRYIYTGQLSASRIQGSSWEKIIGDFKVGSPIEHDDDLASIHELTDYGDASPVVNSYFFLLFIVK